MYATGLSIRPLRSRHRTWLRGAWRAVAIVGLLAAASVGLAGVALGGGAPSQTSLTVRPGDTLWSIAVAHYPDADPRERIDAIERLNSLNGPQIEVGENLQLPPA